MKGNGRFTLAAVSLLLAAPMAFGQDRDETVAQLDVLNHLTQAVASMVEGASAESVRDAVINNVRHDPRWEDAARAVDRVTQLCSEGAQIQSQIAVLQEHDRAAKEEASRRGLAKTVKQAIVVADLLTTGGSTMTLLQAAPTLLGSGALPPGDAAHAIALQEQKWRRSLAEVALDLERGKEKLRVQGGLRDSDIVPIADAQLFVRTIRAYRSGEEDRARRELLLMARARTRFPDLQYHLGLLYAVDSPSRARAYFKRTWEQSGRVLKADRVAGHAALRLGHAALSEALWSEKKAVRDEKLEEAATWGRHCLKAMPRSTDAHVLTTLAEAERAGEFNELLDVCLEVLEIDPDHSWARANVVDALSRMDRLKEAMPHLKALLLRTPEYAPVLLASEIVAESKRPQELSKVLAPQINVRSERRGDHLVPVVRNTGLVPLVNVRATATYVAGDGGRTIAISSAPVERLNPGAEQAFESLAWRDNVQGVVMRLYASNGFAMASMGANARPSRPLQAASSKEFQAWTPARARADSSYEVWFQVVIDERAAALLVCGGKKLLRKVEVGIQFTDGSRKRHHGIRIPAWDPGATVRIALPLAFAQALARAPSCTYFVKAAEGTASVRGAVEPGVRSLRMSLDSISLTAADFAGNDDGRGGAPELFVRVYRNGELVLSTGSEFLQDSFGVRWDRKRPSFDGAYTQNDVLEIQLWDMDLADHDLLVRWHVRWDHLKQIKDELAVRTTNGGVVKFLVERLR